LWVFGDGIIGAVSLRDDLVAARMEAQIVFAAFQAVRTVGDLGQALGNLLRRAFAPEAGSTVRADFTIGWHERFHG